MTKFLLDSGDPEEYRKIAKLAEKNNQQLWGSTTNPSLIAKKLSGQKVSKEKAFALQKEIVLEILSIVPGAVSAEVYADQHTTAEEMVAQGREIASWDKRAVVKLPTTLEAFKARSILRQEHIMINNTLVFSPQQTFAIDLHEDLIQTLYGPIENPFPPFISPFAGRLDDIQEDGMGLVEYGMHLKKQYPFSPWILEASVRSDAHMKRGIDAGVDLITAPAKIYESWFTKSAAEKQAIDTMSYAQSFKKAPFWIVPQALLTINSLESFMDAIRTNYLDIRHPLTDAGIEKFVSDWQSIIQ